MSADFFSVALPLDPERVAELLPLLAEAEEEHNGNVYVDATEDLLPLLDDDSALAMSPNFPVFVAIDRFAAKNQLLGGHAYRWIPAGELAAFHTLVEKLELPAVASALDRGGNGDQDASAGIEALAAGIERAASAELGLLLVCFPA